MRPLLLLMLLAATAFGAPASGRAARQEIRNVAAFARLYGVVRYFYPSDAAASLDWDRFAVHGVKRVRVAQDAKQLETTLEALFSPLGPGIEIAATLPARPDTGAADGSLIAWRYLGAGMGPPSAVGPYRGKRTHRPLVTTTNDFVSLMQTIPALALRGKAIRLRARVRATPRDSTGSSALWLRVDRPGGAAGFFDNMRDRPIRVAEWREYAIEGAVADDATNVAFGALALGGAITSDFDDFDLSVRDAAGAWTPVPLKDAGFEAATDSEPGAWQRVGTSKTAEITRQTAQAPGGGRYLRVSLPPSSVSNEELFESVPVRGAQATLDLGSGLRARVPLTLSDAEAGASTKHSSTLAVLHAALEKVAAATDPPDIDTRLGDVVVAWNVFRHFYPYWAEADTDWDARLTSHLELAYAASARKAQGDALRQLVADARDGHGRVVDPRSGEPARLPIQLGMLDDRLVVTATAVPADVPVGAILSALDGKPAAERMADGMRLASGSRQWKQARALRDITTCETDASITLVVDSGAGTRPVTLACTKTQPPAEKRPAAITDLSSGVWYVDLTRAPMAQITPVLETLARAAGVVFDVRGYPTDAGARILPHLIDAPENDRWMHVAKIIGPSGQNTGWQSFGWNLKPAAPRLAGKIVFLTDGRAISYAESVMGYVADKKLGTIVGGPTAGTNGNVATFPVPGGFTVAFTGMRVTRHDGQAQHHLVGVKPDIPMAPTLAGLRDGRDELLDRALALIRGK